MYDSLKEKGKDRGHRPTEFQNVDSIGRSQLQRQILCTDASCRTESVYILRLDVCTVITNNPQGRRIRLTLAQSS